MGLSARDRRVMQSTDSTAEATVKRLERLGYIRITNFWIGRTRASGSDGMPGKKSWRGGQFIYAFQITEKGKAALETQA